MTKRRHLLSYVAAAIVLITTSVLQQSSFTWLQRDQELGVIIFLAPPRRAVDFELPRICLLKHAMLSVDVHLNKNFGPYDIIVVTARDWYRDPQKLDYRYSRADRRYLSKGIRYSKIHFEEVVMYSGTALEKDVTTQDVQGWLRGEAGGVPGRTLGYRSMCRFWSGRVQGMHFLQKYKYYMRVDDDGLLIDHFPFDPFVRMANLDLLYIFRRDSFDAVHEFIWATARSHYSRQTKARSIDHNTSYSTTMWMKNNEYNERDGSRTNQPYNNFHVSSLALWRTPSVQALLRDIEKNKLFFKYKLGDANLHALIILLLEPRR